MVFAFGLGFYFMSLNAKANLRFILIAIFEKTWVFIIGLSYFIGQASALLLVVVTGDLIFGLLFL
ncbi:MAG: hypothetical protein HXY34_02490 [Candidatus Thorarchaeota archaeon]|nr:hypothetical protein [Candidatus Thorarchaeota archaeon]